MPDPVARNLLFQGCDLINQVKFDGSFNDIAMQERALELFDRAAQADPSWDRPLIMSCFTLYKRQGEGSKRILDLARRALQCAPTVDAVEYFGKSVMATLGKTAGDELVSAEIESIVPLVADDPQSQAMVQIYRAIAAYRQGNYTLYCKLLSEFLRAAESFRPYLWVQAQTSAQGNTVDCNVPHELPGLWIETLPELPPDAELLICASCDGSYLHRYGKILFSSLSRHAGPGVVLHISLVGAANETAELDRFCHALAQESAMSGNLLTSRVEVSRTENLAPVASLARLLAAANWRRLVATPIMTIDFDAAFVGNPLRMLEFLEGADIGLRVRKGCAPWERFTAGASVFMPGMAASEFLHLVTAHAMHVLDLSRAQWWIDQNCLEAAWRHCATAGPAQIIRDIDAIIDTCLLLPTGSEERKLIKLRNSIS